MPSTLEGLQRRLDKLGPEERGQKEQMISEIAEAVFEGSLERLQQAEAILEYLPKRFSEDDAAGLHAARARNTVRVLMRRQRLSNETLRPDEVRKAYGLSRERLRQLREQGRIVGIAQGERRATLYPYWQFDPDGEPVRGLADIIEASEEIDLAPYALHFFMTAPNDRLNGEAPADVLRQDGAEPVVKILRSSGLGRF